MPERVQSLGEEIANAISHGAALLAAALAVPWLIVTAADVSATAIVAAAVFGAALLLLYATSTLYHALPAGRAKDVFRRLDHCAIFVLIAGTYAPFTLGALGGAWGWSLFGTVTGIALVGVVLKAIGRLRGAASLALYLVLGWLAVLAIGPLTASLPPAALAWIVAGGACYTLGVPFFALDHRLRYGHATWHAFVTGGSTCHVVAAMACT
jgi:hemolysin III